MNIFRYIILSASLGVTALCMQAGVTITGKVTGGENEPLEFVSVRVAGTAIGAVTDLDGNYRCA